MWANYAKYTNEAGESTDHAGICIRYACDSRWSTVGLHPVDYTDEVPVVDPTERDEEKFARVMYTKAREWRCESEWRVSSILKAMPPFAPDFDKNSKIRGEGMVSGVIFGMRTPPEIKKKFVERIVSSGRNVELLQLTRNPSTFARELAPCPP